MNRKKIFSLIISMLVIVPMMFALSACKHEHKFSKDWTRSETEHWHICTVKGCKETSPKEAHTFENNVCSECGGVKAGMQAKIGTGTTAKAYATILEAIEAAENDSTIYIVNDIELTNSILIDKDLTFDFGGHKISSLEGIFDVANTRAESKLTLKNGTINTDKWGVWLQNRAYLKVENTFTINANVNSTHTNKNAVTVTKGARADIYGKLNVKGETFALSGNGSVGDGNVIINIYNGAEITSELGSAIYMPNSAQLNILGGKIVGKTAVYIKSATTNINGGEFISTSTEYTEYQYYGNGANNTGDAIVIDACGYNGGNPIVNITNATITLSSDKTHAIAYYTYNGNTATINNTTSYEVFEPAKV